MRCRNCGKETNYLIDEECVNCSWISQEKKDTPTPLQSNWCPLHGAYAYWLPQCPGCKENPPGIKIITTTGTWEQG